MPLSEFVKEDLNAIVDLSGGQPLAKEKWQEEGNT